MFFSKFFLITDTNVEVILGMLFLFFSNVDMKFAEKKLTWRMYSVNEALLTIKQVQFIDCKEFTIATLDLSKDVFVIYVTYLKAKILIHPA